MAIVTATEVTIYSDISCSAGTTTLGLLIPIVQERINLITNNYFLTYMYMRGSVTFSATASTIVAGSSFADEGFVAGDEVYIYNSYRNDGYKTVGSVTTVTLTVSSSDTIINEPSGRNVLISVVSWPNALKYIAAQMIKYDYDDRPGIVAGVNAMSLGPYSVNYGASGAQPFGYPANLIDALSAYTIARLT